MRAFPIIPIWLMIIICITLIIIILKTTKRKTHIVIVILLFIINLRFMIPTGSSTTMANNIDVLIVIDNTLSMNAEDYGQQEKRLVGVKQDCKRIITELLGAKFSVITFSNDAKILVPFTKDAVMVQETIDMIEPIEELYARGSSLNTPKEDINQILNSSYKKDKDRLRILFFISDGEITDDSKLESYSSLKKYIDDGAVLGYGTTKGGYMKYVDKYLSDEEKYVKDYSSLSADNKAISKIDEANLKRIANNLGISYIHMDNTSKIDSKLDSIKMKMTSEMASSKKSNYEDIYYIFVFPLLLLMVLDFKRIWRKII